jgi:hypothetical protein
VGLELQGPDLYVSGGKATIADLEEAQVIKTEMVDLSWSAHPA